MVIYPDDNIPDNIVNQFEEQLSPDYLYIDCKPDGDNNAGVFVRYPGATAFGANLVPPARPQQATIPLVP